MVGHETAANDSVPVILMACQVPAPAAGLVELTTWPVVPTATQKVVVGHEMAVRACLWFVPLTWSTLQVGVAPVGFVEVITSPVSLVGVVAPTAAHMVVEGHEMPVKSTGVPSFLSWGACDHVVALPVGCVAVATRPVGPTATHSVVEGHETALNVEDSTVVCHVGAVGSVGAWALGVSDAFICWPRALSVVVSLSPFGVVVVICEPPVTPEAVSA